MSGKKKVFTISDKTVQEILRGLPDDQKKKIRSGLKELKNSDPESLAKALEQNEHVAGCNCSPGSEPGLGQW
jgi:mRNA-degrading endonuclease RelE of RelBE toxin-antitoxin system